MNDFQASPKNLLLGVFQTGKGVISIKAITHIGKLFGFTPNSMRVTVTRLLSTGVLRQDERGYYYLNRDSFNDKTNLLSTLIGRWHLGEQRRRNWDKTWVLVCLPDRKAITNDKEYIKALRYMGFATDNGHQWTRPNYLNFSRSQYCEYLVQLGLTREAHIFVVAEADPELIRCWENALWPISEYQNNYQSLLAELKKSMNSVHKIPLNQAAVESFILGSKVVNTLATDPLLPEEIMPCSARESLTNSMLEYDLIGKEIWNRKLNELDVGVTTMPVGFSFF